MLIRKGVILLFFDLPTLTREDKAEYRKFRKFILENGYMYMQNSAYVKLLKYNETYKKEVRKLNAVLPKRGIINTLNLTLKEFQKMDYIVGSGLDMKLFSDDLIEI